MHMIVVPGFGVFVHKLYTLDCCSVPYFVEFLSFVTFTHTTLSFVVCFWHGTVVEMYMRLIWIVMICIR